MGCRYSELWINLVEVREIWIDREVDVASLHLYRSAALVQVYISEQYKLEYDRFAWGILITATKP
jgi:hypothetical protein